MTTVFVSPSARVRWERVRAFVDAHLPHGEVVVIGASRGAVDDWVRAYAGELGATFGIHRKTLMGLAAEIAAPRLASREVSIATSLSRDAVLREVLSRIEGSELFVDGGHAVSASFARALGRTIDELRQAKVEVPVADVAPEIAPVLEQYGRALEERRLADAEWVFREASEGAIDWPLCRSPIVILDVALATDAEMAFVTALLGVSREGLLALPPGDQTTLSRVSALEADRVDDTSLPTTALERARVHLFDDTELAETTGDASVLLASAPSERQEATEVVREVLALAEGGVRFDQIAIVLPSRELYASHLVWALGRAKVPAYFSFGVRRPHPGGRALLALLACRLERFSARRLAEYLSLGQTPESFEDHSPDAALADVLMPVDESLGRFAEPDDVPLSTRDEAPEPRWSGSLPRRWERFFGEAGLVAAKDGETGARYYARRLSSLAKTQRELLAGLVRDDPDSPRIEEVRRSVDDVEGLREALTPLLEMLDAIPESATYRAHLDHASSIARRALRSPDSVLAVLSELYVLGEIGPVSLETLFRLLETRLRDLPQPPPASRYGRVFVASPHELRGRVFHSVFVVGLTEGVFPERPREDPLLFDDRRRALGRSLLTLADRANEGRLKLLLAAGAAERRLVVSYPRTDVSVGRARVPSFYALDISRTMFGRLPHVGEMLTDAKKAWAQRLGWPAPEDPHRAIDAVEHDLSRLKASIDGNIRGGAHHLVADNPHLRRALRARFSRYHQASLGPWDGIVGPGPRVRHHLAARSLTERPYSASSLQHFAACPYRFFLHAVMNLAPRESVTAFESMDPILVGNVFHRIVARLTRQLIGEGLLPLREENLDRAEALLVALVSEEKREMIERLDPLIDRVFDDEMRRIREDVRGWLSREVDAETTWVPWAADLSFGSKGQHEDPMSRTEPVKIRRYLLRGAIDSVERNTLTATHQITDYKTGVGELRPSLYYGNGEVLQPLLYTAVLQTFGLDGPVERARLYHATSKGQYKEVFAPMSESATDDAAGVLAMVDRAITEGHLFARPRKGACEFCAFRVSCGREEEARVRRKSVHPADIKAMLADLAWLRERS